jgi:hypothetical protein
VCRSKHVEQLRYIGIVRSLRVNIDLPQASGVTYCMKNVKARVLNVYFTQINKPWNLLIMNTIHNIYSIFPESPCIVNKELHMLVHKYIYSGVKMKAVLTTSNSTFAFLSFRNQ